MGQELKELLKPPFTWQQWSGVLRIKLNDHTLIEFKNLEVGSSHYIDIMDFVSEAIYEKWKRDFSEPLRWQIATRQGHYRCPVCREDFILNGFSTDVAEYKFCPHCGQKLLSPENNVS
jgi:DNA-directed RNA polymerase subunit RPC12/RpoP